METVLKLSHVNKSFGRKKIIDDLSFETYAGEVFGFLGPNGAGKTTTIKVIMGFLSMDSGNIEINGHNLRKNYEKAMSDVGGIVENPEMYKNFSGLANLKMYARLHDGVDRQAVREAVETVGLQNRIHEKVKKYSLGMKQRCGLAQAILHKPRLLILDEPTNGLDPAGIRDLRDLLKRFAHENGVGVFVSSHMLSEMEQMCDRVGVINGGKLLGVKTIKEIVEGVQGARVYRFSVAPAKQAAEILKPAYGEKIRSVAENSLDIAIERGKLPEITASLVSGGVSVYEIGRVENTLEDAFIKLTGGGNTIA